MTHEPWTPRIGARDILRRLAARAPWGVAVWAIALGVAVSPDTGLANIEERTELMAALLGGVVVGLVMTWRLHERLQWTGLVPYLIATVGVLAVIAPLAVLAHGIWPLESALPTFLAMAALGVLLRGVGATAWLAPYRRRNP